MNKDNLIVLPPPNAERQIMTIMQRVAQLQRKRQRLLEEDKKTMLRISKLLDQYKKLRMSTIEPAVEG